MTRRFYVMMILALLLVGLNGVILAQLDQTRLDDPAPPRGLFLGGGGSDDEGDDEGDDELGDEIAGTWLGRGSFALDFDCDGVADADPESFFGDSQSFDDSALYMATNPNSPNVGHGTWLQTGPRQASTNNIVYLLDEGGALQFIARIPGVFDFDADFLTATSTFGAILYLPDQNPLDPSEIPVICTVGQHDLLEKVTVTP